ncbi:MAG: hemolysin family protein [Verrucomicrobiota bacterium JB022]|nr:hemolysin family protein [Verrucomicrobiota bacterium JB022]
MTLLILYLTLAVAVSFLCSILEAVLLSLTPSFISATKEAGKRSGKMLDDLKRDVDRPLAAILSLNTIAHTVGAAGVGAQAHVVFHSVPVSVISGVLTLIILVFSEIIPKTIGATYWRALAVSSAYCIHWLTILLWPLVVLSQGISKMLRPGKAEAAISRDEMFAMAELGHQEGVIDSSDAQALRSIVQFQTLKVHDVFTPRTVAVILKSRCTVREVMDQTPDLTYSRYPVMSEGDTIAGYVLKSDILVAAANDEWDRPIDDFVRKVLVMPENLTLKRAFSRFLRQRDHLAVVVDEFGSFAGVLTLEDVIESLIGHEIMDEADDVEDLRELARQASPYREQSGA